LSREDARREALGQRLDAEGTDRVLEFLARAGACNATINNMIADGVLPKPIKPRPNMVLFERTALLQAIRRMCAAA
jgi:predicted DNA-binding transcriptional regulator AlpA